MCGYLINSRYLIAEIRQGLIAYESSLGGADVSGLWATRDNLPLIVMIMIVMIMLVMIMIVMIMIVMIMNVRIMMGLLLLMVMGLMCPDYMRQRVTLDSRTH